MAADDWSDRLSIPNLVLGFLLLAVLGAGAFAMTTSSASYGPYNDDWNGAAEVRGIAETEDLSVELVRNSVAYSSAPANETVALVLSPDSPYQSEELVRINDFVERGGTLVVADDYGPHANELLRQLGASARLDGRPVRDVRSNYRSAAMPVATPASDHPLVDGVESVTFNHGTVVEPGEATPLLNTSEDAYLDRDRNGELGPNETLEVHTVATVERIGEGRVVVVGDSSAFINAMLERPGNHAFVRSLLSDHGVLLLDHSHTKDLSPAVLAVFALRESVALQLGLGTLAVAGVAVWSRRREFGAGELLSAASAKLPWREDDPPPGVRPDASELAEYLQRRNPDWDRERVERVVSAVERHRNRE